jgi:hypothetical protein
VRVMTALSRPALAAAGAAVVAVALSGSGPAQALTSTANPGPAGISAPAVATLSTPGALFDVATVSGNSAWAVGHQGKPGQPERTLLAHWNGKKWGAVTSPKPVGGALQAIDAVSPTNIWVVGGTGAGPAMSLDSSPAAYRPLIWHWNGKKWAASTGLPRVTGWLNHITVTSGNVWAVGETAGPGGHGTPLILHQVRGHWSVVRSGAPAAGALWGIAASSPTSIWAIGAGAASWSEGLKTDLLHWNGARWAPVSSPLSGVKAGDLEGLATGPGGTAWAVGSQSAKVAGLALVWNGHAWQGAVTTVTSGYLNDVAKIPGSKVPGGGAWAVGATNTGGIVALRWTGSRWASAPTPARPGQYVELTSVSAASATNAWAVGAEESLSGGPPSPIILHWNGQHWS